MFLLHNHSYMITDYSYMYTTISVQLNLHNYICLHGFEEWGTSLQWWADRPLVLSSGFGYEHYKLKTESLVHFKLASGKYYDWLSVYLSSLKCNILIT